GLAVDRFSHLVICTALRALELGGKALWERYDNGDNLLFKESDLRAPRESALFRELAAMSDPLVQTLGGRLLKAGGQRLEEAPLLGDLLPEEKPAAPAPARSSGAITEAPAAVQAPDWNFGDDDAPRPRVRRRKKGGVPVWAWVGGGVAALLL